MEETGDVFVQYENHAVRKTARQQWFMTNNHKSQYEWNKTCLAQQTFATLGYR